MESITKHRFRDTTCHKEEGSLASLQENSSFRIAVFFLGALPQVIKLFAIRGIPWTQALGGMYLVSFLVTECIVVISRRWPLLQSHPPIPADSSSQNSDENIVAGNFFRPTSTPGSADDAPIDIAGFLSGTCFAFSLALPFYFIMMTGLPSVIGDEFFKFRETWLGFLLTFLPYWMPLFMLMLGSKLTMWPMILFSYFFFSNVFLWLNLSIAMVYDVSHSDKATEVQHWIRLALAGVFIFVYIAIPMDLKKAAPWSNLSGWVFLIENIVGSFLYYRSLYDPAGSVKPGWMDQLG